MYNIFTIALLKRSIINSYNDENCMHLSLSVDSDQNGLFPRTAYLCYATYHHFTRLFVWEYLKRRFVRSLAIKFGH